MTITIIAAMDKNGAIGKGGKLPWHIPSEMRHFKRTTFDNAVIAGSNTFHKDLKRKALPHRYTIVLKANPPQYEIKDVHFMPSLEMALEKATSYYSKTFIIGGSTVYAKALPYAKRMILSIIDTEVEGADKFFPPWDKNEWRLESCKEVRNDGELPYRIEEWVRWDK